MHSVVKRLLPKRSLVLSLFFAGMALLSACKKEDLPGFPPLEPGAPDLGFYALTDDNRIIRLNASKPQTLLSTVTITGIETNERILSIDFRPATGQLYGVGSTSRIYVIDPATGTARAIGMEPFTPALDGDNASLDFNPTVDRIRLVTSTGQNLRLNPETGKVAATDGTINGVNNASVNAVAYTNSVAGADSTTLYDIDATSGKLYKQSPPNNGTLVEVGALGVAITGAGGFDISPDNQLALAALTVNNKSGLFSIKLDKGKAIQTGYFGEGITVIGIAIPTAPVAYAVDENNNLLIFNPLQPKPVEKKIDSLQDGEKILGLDMRPVNGQLYALGSSNRIYTINAASGLATAVGSPLSEPLMGSKFGFDFNPTVDRIRVVSDEGQNLRLNPNDGMVAAVDTMLQPGTPMVTAAAYTNNFAGATMTTLFDIDSKSDSLFRQAPPNGGVLVGIGALGMDVTEDNGFDIGGTSNTAYALLTSGGKTAVYTVDLQTGATKKVADFPKPATAMTVGLGF